MPKWRSLLREPLGPAGDVVGIDQAAPTLAIAECGCPALNGQVRSGHYVRCRGASLPQRRPRRNGPTSCPVLRAGRRNVALSRVFQPNFLPPSMWPAVGAFWILQASGVDVLSKHLVHRLHDRLRDVVHRSQSGEDGVCTDREPDDVCLTGPSLGTVREDRPAIVVPGHFETSGNAGDALHAQPGPEVPVPRSATCLMARLNAARGVPLRRAYSRRKLSVAW